MGELLKLKVKVLRTAADTRVCDDALRAPGRFNLARGLADPSVHIADPAVGSGTFPLAILRNIANTVEHFDSAGAVPGAVSAAAGRLYGFELQFGPYAVAQLRLPLANGRGAVVMRVPGSLNAPHQVAFKTTRRFYTRGSKGKFEMDVHDLRHAFTQSEQLPQRFRQLHEQAIAMARGEEMPFPVAASPMAVISIAPLGLFREARRIEVDRENAVSPYRWVAASSKEMIEGVLKHAAVIDRFAGVPSFAITCREGRMDCAFVIGGVHQDDMGRDRPTAWPTWFEGGLLEMGP